MKFVCSSCGSFPPYGGFARMTLYLFFSETLAVVELERVRLLEIRSLDPMEQHVHDAEQVRQRLELDAEERTFGSACRGLCR